MRSIAVLAMAVSAVFASETAAETEQGGKVLVHVVHEGNPVEGAEVRAGALTQATDSAGLTTLELPPGETTVEVSRQDLGSQSATVTVSAAAPVTLEVELGEKAEFEEEVIVTATRSGKRLQDQPVRVEVLEREEIEEKVLMTPGDIAMLLNETSGLRVQVADPALGAANVRVQGLRGRYTQILADGLPLYGGQTGSIGLLQIPPMDLGQVEIIKGAASAFYGASALGGVINLVSRRPVAEKPERTLLLNRTTRAATDAVAWLAGRVSKVVGLTLLGGVHHQPRRDIDADGWADLSGYRRLVARPRLFWDDGAGKSVFVTTGAMIEDRLGGTMPDETLPGGGVFPEQLDTRRFDGGLIARAPIGDRRLASLRASTMRQRHEHGFGPVRERDRHETSLAEASLTGSSGKHTWVVGAAVQGDRYRAMDVSSFDYSHTAPGLFVQDDMSLGSRAMVSLSARADHHSEFGFFVSPRVSTLVRPGGWTIRASIGTGYYAPTPFTEETEAVGLARVLPLRDLEPERAVSGSIDAGTTVGVVEMHATVFGSRVVDPVKANVTPENRIEIVNAAGPTRTAGGELLGRMRWRSFAATATYTLTHSTEADGGTNRDEVPLTPRHAVGLVGAWERHGKSRAGVEFYYTGTQRLELNPYRDRSTPYLVVGILAEQRIGPARFFVNAENLGNVRQTSYDPLLRPVRGPDGRWTVDAWAPLEGRVINGGVRLAF